MLNQLDTDGYAVIKGVLSPEEAEPLLTFIEEIIGPRNSGAGRRNLIRNVVLRSLATERISSVLAPFTRTASLVSIRLFYKSPSLNWSVQWHQDRFIPASRIEGVSARVRTKENASYIEAPASVLERMLAVRVALDPETSENGALQVIRGSHLGGVLSEFALAERTRISTSDVIELSRGSILLMHPLLVHRSASATISAPRRTIHLEYTLVPQHGVQWNEAVQLAEPPNFTLQPTATRAR